MISDIYWVTPSLAVSARPRGGDWLEEEVASWRRAGIEVVVCLLTSEELGELDLLAEASLCRAAGLEFVAVPVRDREVPPSAVDFWRAAARMSRRTAQGGRVLVHCRQGIGRASLMAAAILLRSPSSAPSDAEAAFRRIEGARGRSVPDTPEQREWLAAGADLYRDMDFDLS